jgi:hypothetical protein
LKPAECGAISLTPGSADRDHTFAEFVFDEGTYCLRAPCKRCRLYRKARLEEDEFMRAGIGGLQIFRIAGLRAENGDPRRIPK